MINLSYAEENYLKAIYHLSDAGNRPVSTNAISEELNTKPASVSDMIRKLNDKSVVTYKKYQGVNVSELGKTAALKVIRKHRLWEVFLLDKLKFNWDEVHDVAEQLEHIKSPLLIKRLDEFLGFPKFDPHGDPIPDENGEFQTRPRLPLDQLQIGNTGIIVAVKDTSTAFLKYLDKIGTQLGSKIKVIDKIDFDGSLEIEIDLHRIISVSKEVAKNLLVSE